MSQASSASSAPMSTPLPHDSYFRFRLIRPWTALFYILSGTVLLWLPPQDNLLKSVVALGFIAYAGLRLSNRFLPWRMSSGISLLAHGFLLRQGPFGWRRTLYTYRGFLRVFAVPMQDRLIFVFDSQQHTSKAHSNLALQLEPLTAHQSTHRLHIIATPSPYRQQRFIDALLRTVQNDAAYRQGQPHLSELDPQQALTAYLQQNRFRLPGLLGWRLRFAFYVLRWLLGYNYFRPPTTPGFSSYQAPQAETTSAWGLVAGLGVLAIVAAVVALLAETTIANLAWSVSLLASLTLSGPLVWLLLNAYKQQSGVIITPKGCQLKQPLRFFDRHLLHAELGGFCETNNNQIALLWLKPRQHAPGEPERPPIPKLILSSSIENVDECLSQLHHFKVETMHQWSKQSIRQRKRRRALWRRMMLFLVLPPFAFILILVLYRIAFAVLAF